MKIRPSVAVLVAMVTAATGIALAAASPASAGYPLHVVDLGTLRGFCCSQANAINDAGVVVGSSAVADGENPPNHAFVWRHGHMRDLGTLGGPSSDAAAINDRGDIVGSSQLPDGSTHAVLWPKGGYIVDLGTLGGDSVATGINNQGVVVGRTVDSTGTLVGFRWQAGVMTPITASDGTGITAAAINAKGQIAGTQLNPTQVPVRVTGTTVTILTSSFGDGMAINNAGDVAGSFFSGPQQAFLYHAGVLNALPIPAGSDIAVAFGINNQRVVVGAGFGTVIRPVRWSPAGVPAILPGLSGGTGGNGIALDVDNSGRIVGWSALVAGGADYHAVLWTH